MILILAMAISNTFSVLLLVYVTIFSNNLILILTMSKYNSYIFSYLIYFCNQ